jgi:predicted nucleic acid-binding protein
MEAFLRRLSQIATVLPVMTETPPRICRDPVDDFLIAAAVIHRADNLVTRDCDLLALRSVLEMQIVEPHAFLVLIQSNHENL